MNTTQGASVCEWIVSIAVMIIGAIALAVTAVACAVCMPGRSFQGTPPPLSSDDQLARDHLRAHVVALAHEIGERNWSHYANLERARRYIAREFEAAGYRVTEQAYVFRGETFYNVEAVVGDAHPPSSIVIGAHYDSVEGSPGANDNGSGVASLIEMARLLRHRTLGTPIRFVAFANEEPPYFNTGEGMGSVEYVRGLKPGEQVRFMLALETIGRYSDVPGSQQYPPGVGLLYPNRGNFIAFVANPSSRSLLRTVLGRFRGVAHIPSEGAALPAVIPGIDWSDHRSFWDAGIPALMITDTAPFRDSAYHHSTDTPERLDYERMTRVITALAQVVGELSEGHD